MEFEKIIDNIVQDIENLNTSIKDGLKPDKPVVFKTTVNKNLSTRDQYTMESMQRKQDYINYKRDIRKNPEGRVENYTVIDNDDENLINIISSLDYNKTWSKLDHYQKKKILIKYINTLEKSDALSKDTREKLLIELLDLIFTKKIKSNDINYDIKTQDIITIKQLSFKDGSYTIDL